MPKQNDRLTWEEPPKAYAYARVEYAPIARKLKARKGEWARVRKYDTSSEAATSAHQLRAGRIRAFQPAGTFEAVARMVDGEYWVYARYVGEERDDERPAPTAPEGT